MGVVEPEFGQHGTADEKKMLAFKIRPNPDSLRMFLAGHEGGIGGILGVLFGVFLKVLRVS